MNENNIQNADNQTALYNLIQSIQTKIDSNQNESIAPEKNIEIENNVNNNETIEKSTNNNNNNNNNQNINLASLLNNFDISSILNSFNSNNGKNNENNNNNDTNSFNFSDIDPETLLKIQRLVSKMSKNNPKKDLLRSLKPFLRKSRQDKMGEYMTILSLVDAIDIFGSKGSD